MHLSLHEQRLGRPSDVSPLPLCDGERLLREPTALCDLGCLYPDGTGQR